MIIGDCDSHSQASVGNCMGEAGSFVHALFNPGYIITKAICLKNVYLERETFVSRPNFFL